MWCGRIIHAVRECRAGVQPVQCCDIRKDGEVCVGPEKTLCIWREHFEGVLNVVSSFNQVALDGVQQLPLRDEVAQPPDRDEILRTLG